MKSPHIQPAFQHRSYYLNFGSHLLNNWNVNMFFPDAPCRWDKQQCANFLDMIKAFGFTCFEFWLEPTIFAPGALAGERPYSLFAAAMQEVIELAHERDIKVRWTAVANALQNTKHFIFCAGGLA
jgi:hypothetical protein